MISHYVIRITEPTGYRYLFNRWMLVEDSELARPFQDISRAKRYFLQSKFISLSYSIVGVEKPKEPPVRHNLGKLVE